MRGTPTSLDSAKDLARRNKFQFEAWAVTLIPNVLPNTKQVGDKGVDGKGYIQLGKDKDGKRIDAKIIVSVKGGGNLTPSMVRDLVGTLRNEKAELGVFVCLKEPTRKMKEAAATTGMFETPFGGIIPQTTDIHDNGLFQRDQAKTAVIGRFRQGSPVRNGAKRRADHVLGMLEPNTVTKSSYAHVYRI